MIRYENLKDSLIWDEPYDSDKDLDGEDLGVLKDSILVELTIVNIFLNLSKLKRKILLVFFKI